MSLCEGELLAVVEGTPGIFRRKKPSRFVASIPAIGSFEERVVAADEAAPRSQYYDPKLGLVIVLPETGPQNLILALGMP